MVTRHCHICNGDIHMYDPPKQIYCSEPCVKVAKLVSQRVIKQNKKLEAIGKGLKMYKDGKCRDCNIKVDDNYMYCDECRKTRHRKAGLAYYYKTKGKPAVLTKTCSMCNTLVANNRTYCVACSAKRREEVRHTYEAKVRRRGPSMKTAEIDPKWLSRGTISGGSSGTTVFGDR